MNAMNVHEKRAWGRLIQLGARQFELGGKPSLDIRPIRITSAVTMGRFAQAFREVVGRSGSNTFHVNRNGEPIFVSTEKAAKP